MVEGTTLWLPPKNDSGTVLDESTKVYVLQGLPASGSPWRSEECSNNGVKLLHLLKCEPGFEAALRTHPKPPLFQTTRQLFVALVGKWENQRAPKKGSSCRGFSGKASETTKPPSRQTAQTAKPPNHRTTRAADSLPGGHCF